VVPLALKKQVRKPVRWLRNLGVGPGDALVCSYPRSGSTWLRFLLYEALTSEPAAFQSVNRGIPDPDGYRRAPRLLPSGGRLLKSHDRYWPRGTKVVYLVRDVRDVVLSEYRHHVREGTFRGDLADFLSPFLDGKITYFGSWSDHVRFWALEGRVPPEDLFVLRYESLRERTVDRVADVLGFLDAGVDRSSVESSVRNNAIERMRRKEEEAPEGIIQTVDSRLRFVGRGLVGVWKGELTETQLAQVEARVGNALSRLGYAAAAKAPSDSGTLAPEAPATPD
jgi:hypothetical protein